MRDFEDVPFEGRLGLEFRRLRRFLDLCQDEFGEQCNLTLSVVHNLEKGNTKCDLGTFREFFKPCGSYSLFMFLYASYGDNLRDKFQELFPEIPVEAFDEWVKILAKKYPVYGDRYYDNDSMRASNKSKRRAKQVDKSVKKLDDEASARLEERQRNVKALMENAKLSASEAMNMLGISPEEQEQLLSLL